MNTDAILRGFETHGAALDEFSDMIGDMQSISPDQCDDPLALLLLLMLRLTNYEVCCARCLSAHDGFPALLPLARLAFMQLGGPALLELFHGSLELVVAALDALFRRTVTDIVRTINIPFPMPPPRSGNVCLSSVLCEVSQIWIPGITGSASA